MGRAFLMMKLAQIKEQIRAKEAEISGLKSCAEYQVYGDLVDLAHQYQTTIKIDCKLDLLKEHLTFETECKNAELLAELAEIRGLVLELGITLEDNKRVPQFSEKTHGNSI